MLVAVPVFRPSISRRTISRTLPCAQLLESRLCLASVPLLLLSWYPLSLTLHNNTDKVYVSHISCNKVSLIWLICTITVWLNVMWHLPLAVLDSRVGRAVNRFSLFRLLSIFRIVSSSFTIQSMKWHYLSTLFSVFLLSYSQAEYLDTVFLRELSSRRMNDVSKYFKFLFFRPPVRSNGRSYKMLVMFFLFILSPRVHRGPSADRPETWPRDRKLSEFYNPRPKIRGALPQKNLGPKTCKISVDFIQPPTLIANISGTAQDI